MTLVGVEPVGLVFVYSVLYDDLSYTTHDVCCKGLPSSLRRQFNHDQV